MMKDLFTFVMDKNISIDINSDWFKELWYPLSKKCRSNTLFDFKDEVKAPPPPERAVKVWLY
ncbi:200R [Invertebrate iridescent virus Kaz2018]|uniref:Putative MSV199 domain-containing protein 200R n=1 Tax=Invertebrate iridescent virus 6 TaxID=176652 RepID=200R_IIV6|nr:200R [Invertebrate iridescent virus 6]Q91FX0.1 RecName: Full=Putative MSV199 domain-containing protein 200R [Invertebrate iridescent virus 6]AAK82062.1 200R [Invertebrate iridescent virus 6]QNH08610.1 200R [Invertebrate iridescent virus Kaz2018]